MAIYNIYWIDCRKGLTIVVKHGFVNVYGTGVMCMCAFDCVYCVVGDFSQTNRSPLSTTVIH